MYQTDLHQIFRDGRHMSVDEHIDFRFVIVQGTLPWQPKFSKSDIPFVAVFHTNCMVSLVMSNDVCVNVGKKKGDTDTEEGADDGTSSEGRVEPATHAVDEL